MGNGKFCEIGTSLAETAFMANGLIRAMLCVCDEVNEIIVVK